MKRVHINPNGLDMTKNDNNGKFDFEFHEVTRERELTVVLHFDRSWVSYIARHLWDVVKEERKAVEHEEKALRGEG